MTIRRPAPRRIVASPAAAGDLVAEMIWDRYAESEPRRPFLLAVPAGRTPLSTFSALVTQASVRRLELDRLVVVTVDEYLGADGQLCDATAHYSCRRFIDEHLVAPLRDHGSLPPDRVWTPDPADPTSYDVSIAQAGGLDFVLLASGGGDGHVAFNPPGSRLTSASRIVALAEQTRIDNVRTFPDFGTVDAVPTHGVSIGLGTLRQAREAVLVLLGPDKRATFARVTGTDEFEESWPATVVHECATSSIVADHAAAGLPCGDG